MRQRVVLFWQYVQVVQLQGMDVCLSPQNMPSHCIQLFKGLVEPFKPQSRALADDVIIIIFYNGGENSFESVEHCLPRDALQTLLPDTIASGLRSIFLLSYTPSVLYAPRTLAMPWLVFDEKK